MQSLENSLGTSLFIRSGNKICLTQAGVKLLKYTQRLINLEEEILSNFKKPDETAGNLIIKAPHSVAAYYLPPIIKEFQLKFPNISFDFDACVGFKRTLKHLIWKEPAFNAKLFMIWKKEKYQAEPTKVFIDAVRVFFGK